MVGPAVFRPARSSWLSTQEKCELHLKGYQGKEDSVRWTIRLCYLIACSEASWVLDFQKWYMDGSASATAWASLCLQSQLHTCSFAWRISLQTLVSVFLWQINLLLGLRSSSSLGGGGCWGWLGGLGLGGHTLHHRAWHKQRTAWKWHDILGIKSTPPTKELDVAGLMKAFPQNESRVYEISHWLPSWSHNQEPQSPAAHAHRIQAITPGQKAGAWHKTVHACHF